MAENELQWRNEGGQLVPRVAPPTNRARARWGVDNHVAKATNHPEGIDAAGAVPPLEPPSGSDSVSMRMARAQRAGFHTDMPLYIGRAGDFEEFNPRFRGRSTGSQAARQGVFAALQPDTANEFAALAQRAGQGDSPNIIPALHRARNPARLTLRGDELDAEIEATLNQAWADGYDAVLIDNYTTPSGQTGRQILAVPHENQFRSRFAAFDPRKTNSSNLLAAAPLALGGGAGWLAGEALNGPQASAGTGDGGFDPSRLVLPILGAAIGVRGARSMLRAGGGGRTPPLNPDNLRGANRVANRRASALDFEPQAADTMTNAVRSDRSRASDFGMHAETAEWLATHRYSRPTIARRIVELSHERHPSGEFLNPTEIAQQMLREGFWPGRNYRAAADLIDVRRSLLKQDGVQFPASPVFQHAPNRRERALRTARAERDAEAHRLATEGDDGLPPWPLERIGRRLKISATEAKRSVDRHRATIAEAERRSLAAAPDVRGFRTGRTWSSGSARSYHPRDLVMGYNEGGRPLDIGLDLGLDPDITNVTGAIKMQLSSTHDAVVHARNTGRLAEMAADWRIDESELTRFADTYGTRSTAGKRSADATLRRILDARDAIKRAGEKPTAEIVSARTGIASGTIYVYLSSARTGRGVLKFSDELRERARQYVLPLALGGGVGTAALSGQDAQADDGSSWRDIRLIRRIEPDELGLSSGTLRPPLKRPR